MPCRDKGVCMLQQLCSLGEVGKRRKRKVMRQHEGRTSFSMMPFCKASLFSMQKIHRGRKLVLGLVASFNPKLFLPTAGWVTLCSLLCLKLG